MPTRATINGQSQDFAEGVSILDAAKSVGILTCTSPHRDRYVKTPEYKVTAVSITKE